MPDSQYQLGHEADELEHLNVQGRALAAPTRALVEAAGVCAGMRVLDLGSGAGDMSFVAAEVVGPDGEVVGIERSPEAVAQATARASRRGLANVSFVLGDIHDESGRGPFDAVVGRLVLMYVPDPAAMLRTQAATLRPGGLVAPIEFGVDSARTIPGHAAREPGTGLGADGLRARGDSAGPRPAPVGDPRRRRPRARRNDLHPAPFRPLRCRRSRVARRTRLSPAPGP